MNWENLVVKLIVITKDIDFSHPLNTTNVQVSGTGFFINNKEILTCYHVVKFAINIEITYKQNIIINGRIKHIFPNDDLAIVELETPVENVNILDFYTINTLESNEVYTIGFPLSSVNIKITKGIISGYQGSLIQTDATLNHGNSGGPLVIMHDNKWKIIGVNVSKMGGSAEKTGYVVPIYRFIILQQTINQKPTEILVKKPKWTFYYQPLLQNRLRNTLYSNLEKTKYYRENKIGVRISIINPTNYLTKYFNANEVLISINDKYIDQNGRIKFDFYPQKISLQDIKLWFHCGEIINVKVFNPTRLEERVEQVLLQDIEGNLMEYYGLANRPEYYTENNGLILAVLSSEHISDPNFVNVKSIDTLKILNRRLYCQDLFTVILSDLKYSKLGKFKKYPVGEIIIEINGQMFNNYNEYHQIIQSPITQIKTIDNEIYFI